jgi:hypothetical protein
VANKSKQQQKRRQQALARREKKKAATAKKRATLARDRERLEGVGAWPIVECGINEGWRDPKELVQILVARRRPGGGLAAAIFLVDINCLGIKNAHVYPYISQGELDALRGHNHGHAHPAASTSARRWRSEAGADRPQRRGATPRSVSR